MPSQKGTVYIRKDIDKKSDVEPSFVANNESELDALARRANLVIFEAASIPRFLSTDKSSITICPNRVTVCYKALFSKEEYPMPIENITGARVFQNFNYGSLLIDTFGVEKPPPLKRLKVDHARLARRYILALIECKKANIDLPFDELGVLRKKLLSIGMVREGDRPQDTLARR